MTPAIDRRPASISHFPRARALVAACAAAACLSYATAASAQPAPEPAETVPEQQTPEAPPAPTPPAPVEVPVTGKWAVTLYGFVQIDYIRDSTQSYNDLAGNAQVAREGGYAAEHPRMQFSGRDSRIGLKVKTPDMGSAKVTGTFETDFFGVAAAPQAGNSEGGFFGNPAFRIRHANIEIKSPAVDVLVGQSWQLMGWQPLYFPATWEIPGLPGQLFSRSLQLRATKTIKTGGLTIEAAAAAARPPQRNSGTPEGQAGLRISLDSRTGSAMLYGTTKLFLPLSIAFTGDVRRFSLPEFSAAPESSESKTTAGGAVNVFIPILVGTKDKPGNSLSLSGELAYGKATADLYTGMANGIAFPSLPPPGEGEPAPAFAPGVDPGMVTYDLDGELRSIDLLSGWASLQYWLPSFEALWVAGTYSHLDVRNSDELDAAAPATARKSLDWFGACIGYDPTAALRFVGGYSFFRDEYVDGEVGKNHRMGLTGFLFF
jgi:hypothetical protein